MGRGSGPKKGSDWKRCFVNCLLCHYNDSQQTIRHSTSPYANLIPPEITNPSCNENPQNTTEPLTSIAFMNAETTAEDIEKLLDEAMKRCNSRITAEDSSIGSGLRPQWEKYKEWATSVMQEMEGFPKSITDEIFAESNSLFLPLLKKALGGVGSLHWIATGFSFIAWVFDMMETIAQNKEDVIGLLLRIVRLLKSTKTIWQISSMDHIEDLQGHVEKALRCAVICSSIMEHGRLYRFLAATSLADSIAKLNKDLDSAFEDITTFMQLRVYVEGPKIHRQPTLTHSDGTDRKDDVKEEAMNYLRKVSSNLVVAVCLQGMGGIGKSTIGKSVFVDFQGFKNAQGKPKYLCCRVELQVDINVRELSNIQIEILEKVCGYRTPSISNLMDGRAMLEKKLKKVRDPVFLYLDNVLKKSHLCELLPESTCFPEGSKILVTTRHEHVCTGMAELKVKDCKLIQVKKLGKIPAMNLLQRQLEQSKHGPLNNAEWEVIKPLVKELLGLCDGLPLALKTMGGYITGSKQGPRDQNVWKSAIDGMRKAEPMHGDDEDGLYQRLKFSIDGLDEETKGAFLDVVAFAVGEEWEEAECLVGADRLEKLRERALVEVGSVRSEVFSIVRVHDVLKWIGLKMVEKDKEIRVTSSDGLDFIAESPSALKEVVGLKGVTVEAELLQNMPNLRVLKKVRIERECEAAAKLRHLSVLDIECNTTSSPFDWSACKALKCLRWENDASDPKITLDGAATNITILHLSCQNLQSLSKGVASLTGLTSLDLRGCQGLQSLPEGVGSLTGLTSLDLSGCQGLQSLPEGVGSLTGLTSLDLSGCKGLQSLPEGVGSLTGLTSLDLFGCKGLQSLPEGVGSLTGLTSLDLSRCQGLQSLPEGVGSLTGLTSLYLSGCQGLQSLSDGVGSLTGLTSLYLSGCKGLQSLPEGVGSLTGLTSLDLSGCQGLQSLPEGVASLTGLTSLDLYRCQGLQSLPEGVGSLTRLRSLNLSGCQGLQSLPEGVGSLTGLRSLNLSGCQGLQCRRE